MKSSLKLIVTILFLMTVNSSTLISSSFAGEGHGHEEEAHDDHAEGATEIAPDAEEKSGIKIEKVGPAMIGNVIVLTGRITVNENAKADVRARFPGIVRDVKVSLGQSVTKGQILAMVESNQSLQGYSIVSPLDGVVLARNTNVGDVANDNALFTIADLSTVWAKFHVFPKDAELVAAEQTVRVHTLDDTRKAEAKIEMLFPTADALSQTLIAIAPLDNQDKKTWRPGMTVEGDVVVSEKQASLVVRESALQTMEEKTVVFIKERNSFKMIPVTTGISDGTYVEILSGLKADQSYVSEGSFIVKADIMKSGASHEH